MKKRLILLAAMTGVAWMAVTGCSNKNIDTAKVREALEPALSGDAKVNLETALKAIDQSNYIAASRPLIAIAYRVKLDKKQSAILEDTIVKVKAKAAKQK